MMVTERRKSGALLAAALLAVAVEAHLDPNRVKSVEVVFGLFFVVGACATLWFTFAPRYGEREEPACDAIALFVGLFSLDFLLHPSVLTPGKLFLELLALGITIVAAYRVRGVLKRLELLR